MDKKRAYIIDSHVLVRQTLVNVIRKAKANSFFGSSVGVSFNDIIEDIHCKEPNIVFLGIEDVESEDMQLFNFLRREDPTLPIVVITPCNEEGADVAITCLKNGAIDFITKPVRSGRLVFAKEHFEKRVNTVLQQADLLNLSKPKQNLELSSLVDRSTESSSYMERLSAPVDLVILGGCTGGVQSLFRLISHLPKQLNVPIIILQHLPKLYSKKLAEKLDNISHYKVREARNGRFLLPGQIQVVPGSFHAIVKNEAGHKTITLHRGPKEEDARPSLNVLMRSAGHIYRDRLLSVFLSGGGNDGILGAREAADKGAQIITESEASSLLWDLPKKLEDKGIATQSYAIEDLGKAIYKRANKFSQSKNYPKIKRQANFAIPS